MPSATIRERTIRRRQERVIKSQPVRPKKPASSASAIVAAVLLVACTLGFYSSVRGHEFFNYDDGVYVYQNPYVMGGLSWRTVKWSFTTSEQSNWHPLTWLSHALDCQLFGLDAGYHHLTSLCIHTLNVMLLFLLLWRATGMVGRSFVVAALFAWHPFNVQSVAWIAERKNVLSMFFVLLAIGAYGWYSLRPRAQRMLVVAGSFALSLASKPMTVTLPFLLLLFDYWPLHRVEGWSEPSSQFVAPQFPVMRLILEKWPLFALSAASCAVTVWAQKAGGSVRSLQAYTLGERFGNALYSYLLYVWKAFWPTRFAVFYPHPGASLGFWKPALAVAVLIAISFVVWKQRTRRHYLLVGWLWFLGTLVPVIGIVQVGDQAMADRYAYLPLIGLFVMIAWGGAEVFKLLRLRREVQTAIALSALGVLAVITVRQVDYWQDSVSLWSHTLDVTTDNLPAEQLIALALKDRGDFDQAIPHHLNAIRLNPQNLASRVDVGVYYATRGRMQDAAPQFEAVVRLTDHPGLSPEDRQMRSSAQLNLGLAYLFAKDYSNALTNFRGANLSDARFLNQTISELEYSLAKKPGERGYIQLALLEEARGMNEDALALLENAIRENPGYADAKQLLSSLKAKP